MALASLDHARRGLTAAMRRVRLLASRDDTLTNPIMRTLLVCAMSLPLFAACGPTVQPIPGNALSVLALGPPPIYSLLGFRQDLNLSSEQIEALDSIAQAVELENDSAIAALREIAAAQSRRNQGLIPVNEMTIPLLEEVQGNNRAAARAVGGLLDEEQEAEVCELFEPDADDERDGRTRRARASPASLPADSATWRPLTGWPWCTNAL
jgi:hypothetical protein